MRTFFQKRKYDVARLLTIIWLLDSRSCCLTYKTLKVRIGSGMWARRIGKLPFEPSLSWTTGTLGITARIRAAYERQLWPTSKPTAAPYW